MHLQIIRDSKNVTAVGASNQMNTSHYRTLDNTKKVVPGSNKSNRNQSFDLQVIGGNQNNYYDSYNNQL